MIQGKCLETLGRNRMLPLPASLFKARSQRTPHSGTRIPQYGVRTTQYGMRIP